MGYTADTTTYVIVSLNNVKKFNVSTSYMTFQIKATAGNDLAEVNSQVKKVCEDIEAVVANLRTLKTKMGKNDSMNEQIDAAISGLLTKEDEFKQKNTELFQACDKVLEYIYNNKASKTSQATQIQQSIANIPVYGATEA